MSEPRVLTWDWREQPDLDELARAVDEMTGGRLHLYQVDTQSDQFAIVLSRTELTATFLDDLIRRRWEGEE